MELDAKKLSQFMMELFANPELKQRFIINPGIVLKEKGFSITANKEIKVVEETENINYIVLPYLKPDEKLTPEEMERRLSKLLL